MWYTICSLRENRRCVATSPTMYGWSRPVSAFLRPFHLFIRYTIFHRLQLPCVPRPPTLTLWCDSDSQNTTTAQTITPNLLAQVLYDPNHALNTFLNLSHAPTGQSDRPTIGFEPMETLEARIERIQARLEEFDTQLDSRKEQSHPK